MVTWAESWAEPWQRDTACLVRLRKVSGEFGCPALHHFCHLPFSSPWLMQSTVPQSDGPLDVQQLLLLIDYLPTDKFRILSSETE